MLITLLTRFSPRSYLTALTGLLLLLNICSSATQAVDEWATILEETEAFEQEQLEWLIGEELLYRQAIAAEEWELPQQQKLWAISTQIAPTLGWTNNALRAPAATESFYGGISAEVFFISQPFRKSLLSAFAYGDFKQYRAKMEDDTETIFMSQIRWEQSFKRWKLSSTADFFYGDQILESFEQAPGGAVSTARVRQMQPGASLFASASLFENHLFEFGINAFQARFATERDDFEQFGPTLQWRWQAHPRFFTQTAYTLAYQRYEAMPSRRPSGITLLPEEKLRLLRHQWTNLSEWRLPLKTDLRLRLYAQYQRIEDRHGDYENQKRLRIRPSIDWRPGKWLASVGYDWWKIRYTQRQISFSDTQLLDQRRQGGFATLRREFNKYLSLELRYDYSQFKSPRASESYRRHGIESSIILFY